MKVFVDTSAWLALNDKNDHYHARALEKSFEIKKDKIELVTTDYIIDESITIIRYRVSHKSAVLFGDSLFNSSIVNVVNISDEAKEAARKLFRKYDDKELSYTDCTSFAVMNKLKIRKAFTFDEHFVQTGFEVF